MSSADDVLFDRGSGELDGTQVRAEVPDDIVIPLRLKRVVDIPEFLLRQGGGENQ